MQQKPKMQQIKTLIETDSHLILLVTTKINKYISISYLYFL